MRTWVYSNIRQVHGRLRRLRAEPERELQRQGRRQVGDPELNRQGWHCPHRRHVQCRQRRHDGHKQLKL